MAKDTVQAVREAELAAAALIKDAEEQKKVILADAAKEAADKNEPVAKEALVIPRSVTLY